MSLPTARSPPAHAAVGLPRRSNQGGIKGALTGKASDNTRGRVDNMLAALSEKEPVPVQVRLGGGWGGGGAAGLAGRGTELGPWS